MRLLAVLFIAFWTVLSGCGGSALLVGDEALLEGRPQDAILAWRKVVGSGSDERSAEALLRIANVQLNVLNDVESGRKTLTEVVARFPKTNGAYLGQVRLVRIYHEVEPDSINLVPAALRAIEMRENGPQEPAVRMALADGYRMRGDLAQARIEWEQILELFPEADEVPLAALAIAGSFELQGQVRKAHDAYARIEQQYGPSRVAVEARIGRARMLEAFDDLDAAEAIYLECLAYSYNRDAVGTRLRALRARRNRRGGN